MIKDLDVLRDLICELEADHSLREVSRFRERSEALDRLDAYPPEEIRAIEREQSEASELYRRAKELHIELEATNQKFFETIRAEIRRGAGAEALLPWGGRGNVAGAASCVEAGESYDYLDELVSGVLGFARPTDTSVPLTAEMVAYQPTPARHIFDMIVRTRLGPGEVLVDLGSGLGQVCMLASICSGARSAGIELESAYTRCARHSATELKLSDVSFVEQDAREADLSCGTLFYLYTPFRGTMLREMLDLLRGEAAGRKIRICTFGPCTAMVAAEPWLEAIEPMRPGRIHTFRVKPGK